MRGSTQGYLHTGKALVLDTGAILAGIPLTTPLKCYTTREVVEEVRDEESRALLERLIEAGRLEVAEPGSGYVREAEQLARKAGTGGRLSRVDITIIALALKLRYEGLDVTVASDDYKVQETLFKAGIRFLKVRYRGVQAP